MSTPDRWDECRHPMAVSFPLKCLVDRTRIVGPVRCDGGQRIVDLVQELWRLDAVSRVPVGQIFSEDLACVRSTAKWSFRQTLLFGGFRRCPT